MAEVQIASGGNFPHWGIHPERKGGVESVVLGTRENGELRYVACLDARLPVRESKAVAKKLSATETTSCPFPEIPEREKSTSWSGGMTREQLSLARWVRPKFTAEVRFLEWTRGGYLRHAQVKAMLTD